MGDKKKKSKVAQSKKTKIKRLNLREKIRENIKKKKLQQQLGGSYLKLSSTKIELFNPEKGTNVFDIIPYKIKNNPYIDLEPGDYWHERTFFVHRSVGVDSKKVLCLKSVGEKCPVCEYRERLRRQGSVDLAKALKPQQRQLFLIFDVKEKKYKIFDMPYNLFGKQLEQELENGEDEWLDFAEVDGGFTLRVRFLEDSFKGNTFLEANRIDFVERKHKVAFQDVCLDDLLNALPYDALKKMVEEGEDFEDEYEEEPEDEEETEEEFEEEPEDEEESEEEPEEESEEEPEEESEEEPEEGDDDFDDLDDLEF